MSALSLAPSGGVEHLRHPCRHVCGSQSIGGAESGRDGDRLGGYVVLAEVPEGGESGTRCLASELQAATVRGVNHPDGDAADPDRAARGTRMEHGRRRHLGAELEPAGGLGTVDLNRLAIVAGDGLDHFQDVGKGGADEPACPWADKDTSGETLDFALAYEARKRPVDGVACAALPEARTREGPAFGQLPDDGSNGLCSRHDITLACPKT